jgi:pseudouridine-5'-phosphate glycosidase
MNHQPFIATQVEQALKNGKAVVGLESALLGGALPYPENLELAELVEETVRFGGGVPAMSGVVDGRIIIGMDRSQQERFAQDPSKLRKMSSRDLPIVTGLGESGVTTVASAVLCCAMAGIHVFAGGGIGGVHRGFAERFDISADLNEIARCEVAVVCSGAKVILDLANTLEYLETQGVPVLGFKTQDFPAYFVPSGHPVDQCLDNPTSVAAIMEAKWGLGLQGGIVVANAIPDTVVLDADDVEQQVTRALIKAADSGVNGKAITNFLLKELSEATEGASRIAISECLLANIDLATKIALAFAERCSSQYEPQVV